MIDFRNLKQREMMIHWPELHLAHSWVEEGAGRGADLNKQ